MLKFNENSLKRAPPLVDACISTSVGEFNQGESSIERIKVETLAFD
jgi:hypothetical protein